ncbi:MAG: MBL fold metallo-hydrolase [Syntrophaceae bacterium]|nr:MBL fold metallo-hydrolase [Syntrophaceae bacterium]
MLKEMNRREFLKTSAATGAVLMAGDVLKGGPTVAYGSVKIPEVEKLVITVITDNYYDVLRPHEKIARRKTIAIPGLALHAEHGLAYYIETVVSGKTYTFMFDFGWDFNGVSRNIELLDLDLRRLDALVLSHGHLDHFGNLIQILKYNSGKISKEIPLYLGGEAYARRYANLSKEAFDPGGFADLGQLNREELESLGVVKIIEVKDPTPVVPGAYLTGNIERVTEYEKGSPILFIKRGDKRELDLFMGEQSLIFNVKGKGLVVASACAHAGIVNTVKHAQKMTGIDKVHVVIGGFHLIGAPMPKIQKTIADIKAINPDYVVPGHCAGWEAITGFEREMPKQFVLNMAGTRYVLTA